MKKNLLLLLASCMAIPALSQQKNIGQIISLDPQFNDLIARDAKIEVLADSFMWSEGPVWVKQGGYLLFSDIPRNTIFKWKEGEGISEFLKPSGYTGKLPYSREPGSNGLIINLKGELVACEHGDRRISSMPFARGGKRTLADNYQGRRLNSPNDIVQRSNGDYYFTDPAYGLPDREKDSSRETKIMGVYRISTDGRVTLLIDNMLPNGLAFSPDEKILYVGQSDPDKPIIMAYEVKADGTLGAGKLFFDASSLSKQGLKGVPDGMKVDSHGNLFTTGPGGLLVISPTGKLLGRIEITQPTANCAWGGDGSTLYITANMLLCRIRTKTVGNRF
ncbi:MAG TPA: SMP-30/gluconolactonase/LRE family protein [Puia sp.]|nr:SMP-30/gluconolactonase/LRE family protein [Puia sp.]